VLTGVYPPQGDFLLSSSDFIQMMSSRFIAQLAGGERSFVARQIAGETLIMPVSGRVMDLESIYVMNDVGSRIWELLQSPTSVDRIAETLASEFAVSPERAAEDVAEFIASLDERGLVRQLTE
jgi:hypothetical protein